MSLELLWFMLIAFLWAGYFVLEGFDFGVGMLLPFLPRNERERQLLFESIGPVWDGNEVWLVVAAGATFAAFPAWYATVFSGFYLALLVILVLLILRVVSFEWREKGEGTRWRAFWAGANTVASFGVPLLWGIALASLLGGVPLDSSNDWAGGLADLFTLYSLLAGLAFVALFAFHGAAFLTLRTTGELCERAERAARRLSLPAAALVALFAGATVAVAVERNEKDVFPPVLPALLAVGAVALAVVLVRARRSLWAFAATAAGIVLTIATLFTSLYPRVVVSRPDHANSLTVEDAASSHYALAVISIVALAVVPVVLLYQGWSYSVFRHRLTGEEPPSPLEALERRAGGQAGG